jgi:hypothetical protein
VVHEKPTSGLVGTAADDVIDMIALADLELTVNEVAWYVLSYAPTSGTFICYVCIDLLMDDRCDDGSCSSLVACLPIGACI